MQPIDVDPDQLVMIRKVLRDQVPDREVWAFGSRVTWSAKKFSDLDIAIIGTESVPASVVANLKELFRESDLPFKIDVVDWATTNESFRKIIEEKHVVLQGKPKKLLV